MDREDSGTIAHWRCGVCEDEFWGMPNKSYTGSIITDNGKALNYTIELTNNHILCLTCSRKYWKEIINDIRVLVVGGYK